MARGYFVANPNDASVTTATAMVTTYTGKSGAPHKVALSLANLPKRRNGAAAWPRTPSKVDPQVSHFPRTSMSPHRLTSLPPA